jgi:PAS domain S-box-containing protein
MPQEARRIRPAVVLGVAVVYYAAGRLGLSLAFVHQSASAVWPPTGIALAAFLLYGRGIWPAILAGAFAVNLTTSGSIAASIGIAAGNTLEGFAGAWLVNRFAGGRAAFESADTLFRFAVLAGLLATVISPAVGVTSLGLTGLAAWADYGAIWITWWAGDVAGALVVGPLVILWAGGPPSGRRGRLLEGFAFLSALLVTMLVVFGGWLPATGRTWPLEFVCLPPLLWAAFRLGPRVTSAAVAVLSGSAVWGTLRGFGPFAGESSNEALVLLQAYMGVISVTMLAVSAEVARRWATETEIRELNQLLERRVAERTIELERMQARLLEAQRLAHVGSWEWDIGSNTVWWSEELYRIYGVPSFGATYESFLERLLPEDRETVDATVRRAFDTAEPFVFEHRIVRPDGEIRVLSARGEVVTDAGGRPIRMLGTGQDITERRRAEEERAQLLLEQHGRREAEEASRLKDQFLATLSHELRTPLNAVLGWAQMLMRQQLDPEKARKAIEAIYRNATAQSQLVSDILDVSRINSGLLRLDLELLDLTHVIEGAIDTVRAASEQKTLVFETTVDPAVPAVYGDRNRLRQVVWNLLANAVKFTPSGGGVHVRLTSEAGQAVIAVEDDGPGIDEAFLPYLFQVFRQADDSVTREHAGLGLGLAIARHIVELHGGTVSAANRRPGGAVFTVRLPAASLRAEVPA